MYFFILQIQWNFASLLFNSYVALFHMMLLFECLCTRFLGFDALSFCSKRVKVEVGKNVIKYEPLSIFSYLDSTMLLGYKVIVIVRIGHVVSFLFD